MMNDNLQMIKLQVYKNETIRGMRSAPGYGVRIVFGYFGGITDFVIPPIYDSNNDAVTVARNVVDVMEMAEPEQVYIVEHYDGTVDREEFKRKSN